MTFVKFIVFGCLSQLRWLSLQWISVQFSFLQMLRLSTHWVRIAVLNKETGVKSSSQTVHLWP